MTSAKHYRDTQEGDTVKKVLYLHGFGSSGASGTVELLRKAFWEADAAHRAAVVAPDIPVDPAVALPMLKSLVVSESPVLIIGTSMGGEYAHQLRGVVRVCVNPSFWLSRKYDILHVGKHKWLNKRRDGELEFHITKETIEHFQEMEAHQFDDIPEEDRFLCHGLFGEEDDLCPEGRLLFEEHYPGMSHVFPGGHRMNDAIVKTMLLPYIRSLHVL